VNLTTFIPYIVAISTALKLIMINHPSGGRYSV